MPTVEERTIRFTCDLCGATEVVGADQPPDSIRKVAALAQVGANVLLSGGEMRRMVVKMELCDRCYGLFAGIVAELRNRLSSRRSPEPATASEPPEKARPPRRSTSYDPPPEPPSPPTDAA